MVKYPIELTPVEVTVLKQLVYSELQTYRDRQAHARSHGDLFIDTAGDALQLVADKLERLPNLAAD